MKDYAEDGGKCPQCGEEWQKPPDPRCICNKPMMIYIPPGQHIHITCPVHGDHVIHGGPHVTC